MRKYRKSTGGVAKSEEYKYLKAALMREYKLNKIPVVYKITCLKNDRIYIGSTINPEVRFKVHTLDLKYKKHTNYKMKLDFNSFGEKNFKFEILESFDREITRKMLYKKEQEWMDKLNPYYNINKLSNEHLVPKKKVKKKEKISSPEHSQRNPKFIKQVDPELEGFKPIRAIEKQKCQLSVKKLEELQKLLKKKSNSRGKRLSNLRKAIR